MSSLAHLLRIQVVIVIITHCWGECTYAQVSFTPGLERGRFKFSGITRSTITKLFRFRRCKHPQHKPSQVKPVPVPDSANVVAFTSLKVPAELALLVGLSARLRCAYAACAVTFAKPPSTTKKGGNWVTAPATDYDLARPWDVLLLVKTIINGRGAHFFYCSPEIIHIYVKSYTQSISGFTSTRLITHFIKKNIY